MIREGHSSHVLDSSVELKYRDGGRRDWEDESEKRETGRGCITRMERREEGGEGRRTVGLN